jgi:4-nitrophenyl phosphatase
MISTLKPAIKALVFDMDGVLWKNNEPICDLPKLFRMVEQMGVKFLFATNNATLSCAQYVKKFKGFDVDIKFDQIINSGFATANLLKQKYPEGGPVYVIGEDGLIKSLEEQGFFISDKNALAVIVGMDRNITYEKMRIATLLIRNGAEFIGTNPDKTFPTPEGLAPGGGTFIAAIQAASDVVPTIVGKPFPTMLRMAQERLAIPPDQILAIGDRLDTDIAGGQRAGFKTALVLSGVSTKEEVAVWKPQPDLICSNVMEIFEASGL